MNINRTLATGVVALVGGATLALAPSAGASTTMPPPGSSAPSSAWVHGYQFQQEPYGQQGAWCGPAATRLALTARHKYVSQTTLAREQHAGNARTGAGTDNIGLITKSLNKHIGYGFYENKWGSRATYAKLKADLRFDIPRHYVIVANVHGAQRDTRGRLRSYPGGHYLDVVGYYKSGAYVTIEDIAYPRTPSSGPGMHRRYNMSTANLLKWIKARGYSA